MGFLPDDYQPPADGGKYLKFREDGDYVFRVLGSAVVGTELWIGRRPVRKRTDERWSTDERESADLDQDGNPTSPKHFWAFPVWHDGKVRILELNQVTIQRPIRELVDDEDWGDPRKYDIKVTRVTEGKKVSYGVQAKPAKPLSAEAKEAWKQVQDAGFDLEELFAGGDPFAPAGKAGAAPAKEEEPLPTEEINIDDIEF